MAHKIILTELIDQERNWDMAMAHEAMLALSLNHLGANICAHS